MVPLPKAIPFSELTPSRPLTRLLKRTREVELKTGRAAYRYRVDLDRCRTAAELLGWIIHLTEKTWVKPRHIAELIEHAIKQNGIQINRGA